MAPIQHFSRPLGLRNLQLEVLWSGSIAANRSAVPNVMHFLLIYDLAPDYLARRAQFRQEHLALAWGATDKSELVLGGAVEEPIDQAFLLFRGDSSETARRFAENDPYVKNGLVRQWRVKKWNTVVGEQADSPVRP